MFTYIPFVSTKRIAKIFVPITDESKKGENDEYKAKSSLKDDLNYDMNAFTPEGIEKMDKNQKEFRIMKHILRYNKKIKSNYVDMLNDFDKLKAAYDVICAILTIDEIQYEINKCKSLEELNKLYQKTRDQGK